MTASTRRHAKKRIRLHYAPLADEDRDLRDGIPVTSVPRALLDYAAMATDARLERALERSEERDLFDLRAVEALLSRVGGRLDPLDGPCRTCRVCVHRLPAWGTTPRARASSKPKIHFVDSGVAARALRVTESRLAAAEPQTMTELGHLLETFCVGEALKQASWMDSPPQAGHWRTHDGDEVDLVLERDDGALAALEVKAAERVRDSDFRSLRKLREALGERFLGGVALHLGPHAHTHEDRLHAIPADRLWRFRGAWFPHPLDVKAVGAGMGAPLPARPGRIDTLGAS